MLLDLASFSTPPPSPLLQETGSTYGQGYGNWNSGFAGSYGKCSFILGLLSFRQLGIVFQKTTIPVWNVWGECGPW